MYNANGVCLPAAQRDACSRVYKKCLAVTFVSAQRYDHDEPRRKRKTLEELASSGGSDFVESRKRVFDGPRHSCSELVEHANYRALE